MFSGPRLTVAPLQDTVNTLSTRCGTYQKITGKGDETATLASRIEVLPPSTLVVHGLVNLLLLSDVQGVKMGVVRDLKFPAFHFLGRARCLSSFMILLVILYEIM